MLALLMAVASSAADPLTPLITIPRTSVVPTIDGKLSEGEWTSAALIPYLITVRGEVPAQSTTARICYTDRAIYMAVFCYEELMPKLEAAEKEHDGSIWGDDIIEIFIQPGSSFPYYHLAFNSRGATYDAINSDIMKADMLWEPAWKVAVTREPDRWVAEVEIPIADLGVKTIDPGDSLSFNICRERKPMVENSSWSPLLPGQTHFHVPERFGALVFGDETVPLVDVTQFVGLANGIVRRSGQVRNPLSQPVEMSLDTRIDGGKTKPIVRPITVGATPEAFDLVDSVADEGALNAVLECSVGGKTVYRAVRPFYVPPVRARLGDLTAKLKSLETSAAGLPKDSALADSIRSLTVEIDGVASEIAVAYRTAPERVGEITRSLDEIERGILAAQIAFQIDAKGGQAPAFVMWATDPWVQLKPGDLPPQGPLPIETRAAAYRGETVYLAANITNLSSHTLDVRIIPGPFSGPADVPSEQVELHTCAFVPEEARSTDLTGDALPLADSAGREVIPAAETRQAFVIVRTKDLPSGDYSGAIEVMPTAGGPSQKVGVKFTVYPLDLPNELRPMICTWGGILNIPWAKPDPQAYLTDALGHGVNIFLMPPQSAAPKLDKDGNITAPIDYAKHDQVIAQYRKHGMMMLGAYSIGVQWDRWANNAGYEYMGPAYRKGFINWIRDWIAHLKSQGMSYKDFAFELVDEPAGKEKFQLHLDTGKLMREADPKARIVMTTNFVEDEKLRAISPYVDVWVPSGNTLETTSAREFIKKTGKEVWMYVCAGDSKRLSPITYYRILPWQAFRYDLQGWGFFAHMWNGESPWDATNNGGKYLGTYTTIYPGVSGPVTSRRWECYFKGHEDFRALHLLKSLIARGEKAGLNVTEARSVLNEAMNGSAGLQEMKKNSRTAAEESAFLTDIRRKVAEASIKLSNALGGFKDRQS